TQLRRFLSWSWTKLCQFGNWLRGWIVWGWTQLCRFADWAWSWIAYGWNQFVRLMRWVGRGIAHAYRYVRTQLRRFLSWSWTKLCQFGNWLRGWITYGWNQFVSFVKWVGKWWGRLLDAAYGTSGQQAIILHLANIGTAGLVLYAGIQLSLSLTATWLVGLSMAGAVFAAFASYLLVGALLPSLRNWTVGVVISAAFGYWLYDFHLDLVEPRIAVIAATVGFLQTFLLVYPMVCALFLKVLSLVRLAEPLRRLLDRAYTKAWQLLGDFWNALGRLARYIWTRICLLADWLWRTIVVVWNKFTGFVRRLVNLLARGWRQFLRVMDYCWRQFVVFLGFIRRKAGEVLAGLRRLFVRFWNFVKPAFRVLINAYNTTYRSESQELILHSTNIAIAVALSGLGIFLSLQLSSSLGLGLGIVGSLLTGWIAYLWFGAALVRLGNWMVGGVVTVVAAYAAAMHFLPSGMLLTAGAVALSGLLTFFVLYPVVCASLIGVLKLIGLESGLRSFLKSVHQSLWNRAAGLRGLVAETYVGIRDGAAKTAREVRDWVYALWNRSDRNRRNDQEEDREREEEPRR
ncbi:MAG: hypothetical protein K2W82_18325, partial [Candidatus Obscuribacterales bacterium]|nr:hypothetical protein [Candidatus Obscuribacterales bacterium]